MKDSLKALGMAVTRRVTLAMLAALGVFILQASLANAEDSVVTAMTEPADLVMADDVPAPAFEDLVTALITAKSTQQKAALIKQLAASADSRKRTLLVSLQEGNLYYRKSDKRLVYIQKIDAGIQISDVFTAEDLGVIGKRKIKKLSINNKLRNQLRSIMAMVQLSDDDVSVRLSAARDLLRKPDRSNLDIINQAFDDESDTDVRYALELAAAMIYLSSDKEADRLSAISVMNKSLSKDSLAALTKLMETDSAGNYKEPSEKVRAVAQAAIKEIKASESFYRVVENLFFGVSLGSVLLLAAVGLAITFGVMGVINMAHGEMIMLGAYTTYVIQLLMPNMIEMSILVAIPAAFLVSGTMGILIERTVIRHLYGRPLETLLATFGLSLVLQQLVRTIFSPLNKSVITPEWMSGSMEVNGFLSLTYNRMYIIVFSIIVLLALVFLLKKTFVGLQMRAVTQNRAMANSMGIRASWVDALTFGLGSGIAGVAGVALSQLTNVGPNLGQAYIIDSFMVVVFGGVGNLFGTFFAAMSLGITNKLIEPMAGAVLGKILVLVFIILFIQWRPRGLFAIKGRFVED